jgi:glycosyltransferase involved in cell wall biosynthesis
MRVLMLSQMPGAAGPTPGIATLLADGLQRAGCSVATHSWGRSDSRERVLARAVGTLRDVRSVSRMTRRQTFDLVLVHTAHDWRTLARDIPLAWALRRRRVPVVLHLHGSRPERLVPPGNRAFRAATALLLRAVNGLLVLSRDEQERWTAFNHTVRVRAIRNPYAPHMHASSASPESQRGDAPTVLFVGRLLPEKGVFELLEAIALVVESAPCRLVFVGEGPCAADLAARVRALGLSDRVSFAGFLTGADLDDAFASADLFALPTYWPEGFPTVLAEAMEAGLPIVTSRIRGAADHLVEGEQALFVRPRDVHALAVALVRLLEDPDLRQRMGAANRRRLEVFEPSVVVKDYLDALEYVLSDRALSARSSRS